MDIKWEMPPSITRTTRANPKEREIATQLRDRPDQWARVEDFTGEDQRKAGQFARYINTGQRAAFRTESPVEHGEFEAISRKIPGTDITAVFVRYATLNND